MIEARYLAWHPRGRNLIVPATVKKGKRECRLTLPLVDQILRKPVEVCVAPTAIVDEGPTPYPKKGLP